MILKANNKPLRIIGIPQSTITQEGEHFIRVQDGYIGDFKIITPDEFLALTNKSDYQYLCMFTLDTAKRIYIINLLDSMNLDCFTYIHNSSVLFKDLESMPYNDAIKIVGRGTFIFGFTAILLNSKIGNHCIIEAYCLISHYCELKDNVIMHSGVMIAGKTTIGANSCFNFKAAVLNAITICDDVEVGAISTVTKDITRPGRYIGSVARYVGERIQFDA